MEEKEPAKFVDWINNIELGDIASVMLIIVFTIVITIFVVRAFRNKSSA